MKAQHRHELQTNELADKLGIYLQRLRPYSQQIILGGVAIVVVVSVLMYMNNQRRARAGASWSDYFQALGQRDAAALTEVAQLHGGTVAGLWAEQAAGDVLLATGAGQMFSDREEAEKSLRDAEKHFKTVEQGAEQPFLRTRAQYGLAQTYETLADVEKACDYYGKVSTADPNSALGKAAKNRLDQLSKDSRERWYAWFERQEPPQPEPGAGGIEPNVPDDLETLPSRPDLSFPGGLTPSSETPDRPEEPTSDEPTGDEKPAPEASEDEPSETPQAQDVESSEQPIEKSASAVSSDEEAVPADEPPATPEPAKTTDADPSAEESPSAEETGESKPTESESGEPKPAP